MDLLEDTCHYIASLPEETDLYITSTEDKIPQIQEYMQQHGISHQPTFIPVINRGRGSACGRLPGGVERKI